MKAGRLRHRVDIQKWVADRDTTTGEVAETWITNTTEWADVRPISGRERMEAAQVKADITHAITIRYKSDLEEKDRIKWGDRVFHIEGIINVDERDRELQILAKEQVD